VTDFCARHGIEQGFLVAIGAVRAPRISSYDFEAREYRAVQLEGDWELLGLNANVSLRDGRPFIHPHVLLADPEGHTRGGHLEEAEVLVAEVSLVVLEGETLERVPDEELGLSLWRPLEET
jgi:hypothetical protein